MKKRLKMLAPPAIILVGYAAYHYWDGNSFASEFWSTDGSNTLMCYAISLIYTITLVAASTYAFIGEKAADYSPGKMAKMRDRSDFICFMGCLLSSIFLVIWFNNFISGTSAAGSYAYYIDGVRVSRGSMIANYSMIAVIFGTAIGTGITMIISRIPSRIVFINRLKRESLARTATDAQDRNKSMSALHKLSDQRLLCQVARDARDKEVSMIAINMLSDQKWLSDLAIYARDKDVCMEAFNKISDQKWLSKVATYSQNEDVSVKAFNKLSDQEWLSSVAQNSRDKSICINALNKISDQKWLFEIAKNSRDNEVKMKAVKKISDQKWLCEVAKNPQCGEVCVEAAKKVSDQECLSDIVKNAWYGPVKKIATLKLSKLMENSKIKP